MKKIFPILFYLIILSYQNLFSQASVYQEGEFWGVITDDGKYVPARYDTIGAFKEGIAFIKKGNKYGYVNSKGVEISPLKYSFTADFRAGVGLVGIADLFGYVDKLGNEIIPIVYNNKSISYPSDGLIRFKEGKYWNYYDTDGKIALKTKFDTADDCYFNAIRVYTNVNNKKKIEMLSNSIDSLIKVITPKKIFKFSGYASIGRRTDRKNLDDLLEVGKIEVMDSVFKLGYIDEKFLDVYKDKMEDYIEIREDLDDINKKLNYKFFDLMYLNKSNAQYPKDYEDEINEHNKLESDLNSMLNIVYTKISYDKEEKLIQQFSNTITKLKEEKAWGFIDREGAFFIEPKFKNPFSFISYNLCIENLGSENSKKYMFFNRTGEFISDAVYTELYNINNKNFIGKKSNDKIALLDFSTGNEVSKEYNDIAYIDSTTFKVKLNNAFGIINEYGEEVIPPIYDNLKSLEGKIFLVKQYEYYGIMDKYGKIVIPLKYDEINIKNVNIFSCRLGNQYELIDFSGKKITSLRQIDFKNFALKYSILHDYVPEGWENALIEFKDGKDGEDSDTEEEPPLHSVGRQWFLDVNNDGTEEMFLEINYNDIETPKQFLLLFRFNELEIFDITFQFSTDIRYESFDDLKYDKGILSLKCTNGLMGDKPGKKTTKNYRWNGYEFSEVKK